MAELEFMGLDDTRKRAYFRAHDGYHHEWNITDAFLEALHIPTGVTPLPENTQPDSVQPDSVQPGTEPEATQDGELQAAPNTEPHARQAQQTVPHTPDSQDSQPCQVHADDADAASVDDHPSVADATAVPVNLRPRDIQERLRAGDTAEYLAELSGLTVEQVQRFEWPVITEREFAIGQVRAHRISGLDRTSALGELADARLAGRGVQDSARWSARREGNAPWVVEVRFSAGDRERSARWTFALRTQDVTALDDEARWLSQPDDPVTPEVFGVPSVSAHRSTTADDDIAPSFLDDLADRRGRRSSRPAPHPVVADGRRVGFDDMMPNHPSRRARRAINNEADAITGATASVVDLGQWNPRKSRSAPSEPLAVVESIRTNADAPFHKDEPQPVTASVGAVEEPRAVTSPTKRVKGRAPMPTWDEIMFGQRGSDD
ncbi:MAG: DUF3071 domain-containing protein [Cellulomonadaceae bacterium]|jgi:hypothetical protein|nr:DUF3071 domain-containing protein [Cellulomonadaceae bacterium]